MPTPPILSSTSSFPRFAQRYRKMEKTLSGTIGSYPAGSVAYEALRQSGLQAVSFLLMDNGFPRWTINRDRLPMLPAR